MSLARSLRLLLALLMLGGQQLAVAHQIWHVGDKSGQPAQQQLCDKHEALGTVAGALNGAAMTLDAEPATSLAVLRARLPAASTPGLVPTSRGPPPLL